MKVFKLDECAKLPTVNYFGDAGLDFYALQDYLILEDSFTIVRTGIGVLIPNGYVGILKPKGSSEWLVGAGVVDQNYTGEILFKIHNPHPNSFIIAEGDPIGQMITLKNLAPTSVEEVDKGTIADTNRGDSGGMVEQQTVDEQVADYYNSLGVKKWD